MLFESPAGHYLRASGVVNPIPRAKKPFEVFAGDTGGTVCYHFDSNFSTEERDMPHALIRDIDPAVLERLKERARKQGRSLQSELKSIIEQAAGRDLEEAHRAAERIRKKLAGRRHTDSSALIAADRRR